LTSTEWSGQGDLHPPNHTHPKRVC